MGYPVNDAISAFFYHFYEFLPDLLDVNLTATVVILFVMSVRQFLKGAPKIYSYALWGIVLLRLLVPVSIESPMSFVPERTAISDNVNVNEVLPVIQFESAQDRVNNEWQREHTEPGEPLVQTATNVDPQAYLTLAWIGGMMILLLRSLLSWLGLRKRVKVAVSYRKRIYLADDIDTPFVMGFFPPKIYLPGTLDPAERKYIIAHERHHIRRGDHIFKALGFLAVTIHWFNPFVWAAFVLAGRDMEMSCDEAVIRKLGEDVRAEYSASLLNLATGHRMFAATPLAFGEGDPTGRVRNLARWKKPALWVTAICLVCCSLLAVCLLTDPISPFPTEFKQYFHNREKAELLSGTSQEEYADSDLTVTFVESSGPTSIQVELWYREGAEGKWTMGETALLELQEGWTFHVPSGCTFAVAATVTEGNNGYAGFNVFKHGNLVMDKFERDFLTDPNTKTADPAASAWTVPEETVPAATADVEDWGVTIVPERVSRTGATAAFRYDGSVPGEEDSELIYGDFLSLDRMENGSWVPVAELPGYEYYVGDSYYPVMDGYGMVHEWPERFGELPDGSYRMGKKVTLVRRDGTQEERMVYGEFSIPGSILTGPIPLEDLPEIYSAEQAMIDGCFVSTDGVARENKDLFREFAENSRNGIPSFIRVVNWHYGEDSHWSAMDLRFDGSVYTLTTDDYTYTFSYLKHYTGEKAWEDAPHDAYEFYVLVNDETVTMEDIYSGKLDMSDWKNPAHWTVYADLIYLPKQPQLPQSPAQAVLLFEGEPLLTITDFDRLEKIWLLFSDAELLGYEPKTHSIGVGLDLLLVSETGETLTIELNPDSDICRIGGEYVFYGAFDEPDYILKLWEYLGLDQWPEAVYARYPNAFRGE